MSKKAPPPTTRPLNVREQNFVRLYPLCNGNGAKAAAEAGYSVRTARHIAYELLQRPTIRAAIDATLNRGLSKLDVSIERVLQERARLAFYDVRKFFRDDGTPIPLHELDDDTAAAVQGFKLDGHFVGRGKARKWVTTVSEYKLPSKGDNLTPLDKHLGLYRDDAPDAGVFNIHIHLE